MADRRTALVTGASSGLGLELARCFARGGFDVALVARTEPKLRELADELSSRHGVEAHVIPADLSADDAPDRVMDELASRGIAVDALVNSAGFTQFGPLAAADERTLDELLHVNVAALTRFTRLALPGMLERRWGRIVNLSSNAAFQPGPLMAAYYASKSYVLSFSIAVHEEVRGSGVSVTALCPGPTESGFQVRGEMVESKLVAGRRLVGAEKVARWGFDVAMRGKPYAVHGLRWKSFAFATRFMPRTTAARMVGQAQAPIGY